MPTTPPHPSAPGEALHNPEGYTMTREELAGLLSTLDFRPAGNHPQDCLPMADAILAALPSPPPAPTPTRAAVDEATARFWRQLVQYRDSSGDSPVNDPYVNSALSALLALFDAPPRGEAVASEQRGTICIYCGDAMPYDESTADVEALWKAAIAHDEVCRENPIRIERDKLRAALPVPPAGTREATVP